MSIRLFIAINDPKLAGEAAAMADEGDEIEVVERLEDLDQVIRALARVEPDVLVLHDSRGAVPVLAQTREVVAAFPHIGVVILSEPRADLARTAMQAGARDVVQLPLSLEELHQSVLVAAEWTRGMRGHFSGEAEAAAATGVTGRVVALAGAKGGTGTTTLALHLALHVAATEPERGVCLVDFDLQAGDLRSFLKPPHQRSIVDLVKVAGEQLSVRDMDETLYEHRSGVRVLFAPEEGEYAEDVTETAARNVLGALRARHDLTIVDLGSKVLDASLAVCEMADAVVVVTTPDILALRGAQRIMRLWERLQVAGPPPRVVVNRASRQRVVQADVVRSFVGQSLCESTVPADFPALEHAVNTGMPERLEDRKLRGAIASLAQELELIGRPSYELPEDVPEAKPTSLLARLTGERGQSTVETMGLIPVVAILVLALWQIGLVGYTYMATGNAAREGARELAVGDDAVPAIRDGVPKSWRDGLRCTVGETRVRVSLAVPAVLPGLDTAWRIDSSAGITVEDAPVAPIERSVDAPPKDKDKNPCAEDDDEDRAST